MEFDNALAMLSKMHRAEIAQLTRKIVDLETALDKAHTRSDENRAMALEAMSIDRAPGHKNTDTEVVDSQSWGEIVFFDRELRAAQKWVKLSEHVLNADDPKGIKCIPERGVWKRWMQLGHRLIRYSEKGGRESRQSKQLHKEVLFDLISVWVQRIHVKRYSVVEHFRLTNVGSRGGDLYFETGVLGGCILHPHSMHVFLWGLLSGMLVLYDVFMIPLDLCGLASNPTFLAWAFLAFWISDMVVSCSTGVERSDCVVDMRRKEIWRAYAKSWLFPDLTVIFADVVLLGVDVLADLGDDVSDFSKTMRANRLFRLLRLIRLCRVRKVINSWYALITPVNAAFLIMVGNLVQQVMVIIILNHYVACLWYGLAAWKLKTDEPTWLEAMDYPTLSNFNSYVYSLHWALTQFSPSTQDIRAQNPYERAFALCVALFALVSFSWFVGQLNTSLNQLFTAKRDRTRQEQLLRDFFRLREISTELGAVIMKFFYSNFEALKVRTTEEDIRFFSEVPESMRLRLHEEMYMHVLMSHTFFCETYNPSTRTTLLKICHTAMREISAHPSQDIFILGAEATSAYVVTQGKVLYKQRKKNDEAEDSDWIAEMGFWVKWEHLGTLSAPTAAKAELAAINLSTFHKIFALNDVALHDIFRLLAIFAVEQVELAASQGVPPSDMPLLQTLRDEIMRRATAFLGMKQGLFGEGSEKDSMERSNSNDNVARRHHSVSHGSSNRVSLGKQLLRGLSGLSESRAAPAMTSTFKTEFSVNRYHATVMSLRT